MADEQIQNGNGLNPDLMGYPSVDALVNAKRASDVEAKRIMDERDRYKQQYELLVQSQIAPANPRSQSNRWEDKLDTLGIPVDAVREAIREEASALVQQAFQPIAQGVQARTQLLGQYPEYQKFESDVASFIQSDPNLNRTYQSMYQADPGGALDWAYLKFGENRRRAGNLPQPAPDTSIHAAIPTNRTGDARRLPQGNDADIEEAFQRYKESPNRRNAEDFARARLKSIVSDEHLAGGRS